MYQRASFHVQWIRYKKRRLVESGTERKWGTPRDIFQNVFRTLAICHRELLNRSGRLLNCARLQRKVRGGTVKECERESEHSRVIKERGED